MDQALTEAYADYIALIKAQGLEPAQALHNLSGHLHPLTLSRLKQRLKREQAQYGKTLPVDR